MLSLYLGRQAAAAARPPGAARAPGRDRARRRRPALARRPARRRDRARVGRLARDPGLPGARRRLRPAGRAPTTSIATACPRSCPSSWRWGGRWSCRTATSATTSSDGRNALLLEPRRRARDRGPGRGADRRRRAARAPRRRRPQLRARAARTGSDNSLALGALPAPRSPPTPRRRRARAPVARLTDGRLASARTSPGAPAPARGGGSRQRLGEPDDLTVAAPASPNASVAGDLRRRAVAAAGALRGLAATSSRSAIGTVRDFADSTETMPGLAAASADMKNAAALLDGEGGARQRPARLRACVEIGAGEPLVAGLLSRLGYEVTVVDPYDGSGNGPREYSRFTAAYPDLRLRPRPVPAGAGPRRRLRLRLLDLGARARPARGDRRRDRRRRRGPARARRLLDPRRRPRARRLGRRLAPRGPRADRRRLRARLAPCSSARSSGWSSIPRPTWSRPRPTTNGAARCPYDSYPMRRIGSVNLFARY